MTSTYVQNSKTTFAIDGARVHVAPGEATCAIGQVARNLINSVLKYFPEDLRG